MRDDDEAERDNMKGGGGEEGDIKVRRERRQVEKKLNGVRKGEACGTSRGRKNKGDKKCRVRLRKVRGKNKRRG